MRVVKVEAWRPCSSVSPCSVLRKTSLTRPLAVPPTRNKRPVPSCRAIDGNSTGGSSAEVNRSSHRSEVASLEKLFNEQDGYIGSVEVQTSPNPAGAMSRPAEASWEEWLQLFQDLDGAAEESSLLKLELKDAVRLEQYSHAAKVKQQLEALQARDHVGALRRTLDQALAREQYTEASYLRDKSMAWLSGWWAGRANRDPVGHLLHVQPEFGRWTGRLYTPKDIADLHGLKVEGLVRLGRGAEVPEPAPRRGTIGTPALEVFVKQDKKNQGHISHQAVMLQAQTKEEWRRQRKTARERPATPTPNGEGGTGSGSSGAGVPGGTSMRFRISVEPEGQIRIRSLDKKSSSPSSSSNSIDASSHAASTRSASGVGASTSGRPAESAPYSKSSLKEMEVDHMQQASGSSTGSSSPAGKAVKSNFSLWELAEVAATMRQLAGEALKPSSEAAPDAPTPPAQQPPAPGPSSAGPSDGNNRLPYGRGGDAFSASGQQEDLIPFEMEPDEIIQLPEIPDEIIQVSGPSGSSITSASTHGKAQQANSSSISRPGPSSASDSESDTESDPQLRRIPAAIERFNLDRFNLTVQAVRGPSSSSSTTHSQPPLERPPQPPPRPSSSSGHPNVSSYSSSSSTSTSSTKHSHHHQRDRIPAPKRPIAAPDSGWEAAAAEAMLASADDCPALSSTEVRALTGESEPKSRSGSSKGFGDVAVPRTPVDIAAAAAASEAPLMSPPPATPPAAAAAGMDAEWSFEVEVQVPANMNMGGGAAAVPALQAQLDGVVDRMLRLQAARIGRTAHTKWALLRAFNMLIEKKLTGKDGIKEAVAQVAPMPTATAALEAAAVAAGSSGAAAAAAVASDAEASGSSPGELVVQYHRVSPPASRTDLFDGLYIASFGPHGCELLRLQRTSIDGEDAVQASKLTGDEHVPAGSMSFKVKVGRKHKLGPKDVYPDELGVTARYKGQGRVAESGFVNPRWVPGELLVFSGTSPLTFGAQLGFVWSVPGERRFLILLHRVDLDMCGGK